MGYNALHVARHTFCLSLQTVRGMWLCIDHAWLSSMSQLCAVSQVSVLR